MTEATEFMSESELLHELRSHWPPNARTCLLAADWIEQLKAAGRQHFNQAMENGAAARINAETIAEMQKEMDRWKQEMRDIDDRDKTIAEQQQTIRNLEKSLQDCGKGYAAHCRSFTEQQREIERLTQELSDLRADYMDIRG